MSFTYVGWDTHAYSAQFKKSMEERNLDFMAPVESKEWDTMVAELNNCYSHDNCALRAIRTQNDRIKSSEKGVMIDSDLYRCDLARIMLETWKTVKNLNDNSLFKGFGEILCDIGSTCLQGATHRLLTYYVALTDSKVEK